MFTRWRVPSRKKRFIPTIELLEKREVLDAALRFHTQQITVPENQTTVPVTVAVELTEPSATPVEFFCNLLPGGSAKEELDFRAHREHFTIPAGALSIAVPLAHIYEDTEDEPAETFSFELVRVDGTAVPAPLLGSEGNPTLVTITITDNDLPPLPPTVDRGLIEAGRLSANQETWHGDRLGVSLSDGTVSTTLAAGSLGLVYNGATVTNPITQLRYYFDATPPAAFGVRLTFQGNTTETVYNGSGLEGNQEVRLGVVIPIQGLTTGRYSYTVEVVANGAVLHAYTGNLNWVNRNESVFGSGWGLGGMEELVACSGGVLLVEGDGSSLWYADGTTPGSYLSPSGDTTTLVRNSNGSFTRTHHDGVVAEFDSSGRMLSKTDRIGNTTTLGYDANGLLTSITDAYGQVATLVYSLGKLTTVTDPQGRVFQISQNNGNLTALTLPDPDGNGPQTSPVTTLTYDGNHHLTAFTDARGKSTQVNYDGNGRVSTVTQPDGSITQIRSAQSQSLPATGTGTTAAPAVPLLAQNHQAVVTDERGNLWKTELDTLGFGLGVKQIDPLGNTTLIERNPHGWITAITDPLQRKIVLTLDQQGNVLTTELPDGAATSFSYNPFGQLTRMVEPDLNLEDELPGPVTTWVYDSLGNLVRQIMPDEDTDALNNPMVSFTYDSHGLLMSRTDERGYTTSYLRDNLGRLVQVTHPDGNNNPLDNPVELFSHDAMGNLASSTDELGYTTLYTYDLLGRLIAITHPDGNSNSQDNPLELFAHDAEGNLINQTNPLGNTTVYGYDNRGRLQSVTGPDPDGNGPQLAAVTSYICDPSGNITQVVNPVGRLIGMSYDAANRLTRQTRGTSWAEDFAYDNAGQMVEHAGPAPDADIPANRLVKYKAYSPQGLLIHTHDTMMRLEEYQYNAWGELAGFT